MLRIQGIVAVTIPWVVAVLIAPGSWVWGLIALVVPTLFAALNARHWQVWLAPVSGLVSIVPVVPWWASLTVALAVALVLVLRPPLGTTESTAASWPSRPAIRWGLGGVLLAAAVALASYGLLQVRGQDAAFDAGQEAAAEMWLEEPATDEPSSGEPAPIDSADSTDSSDGTDELALVGQPQEVQEEAAAPVKPPFAKLRFVRKGTDEAVVTDRVLYVGPDITERGLAAGPGHYPQTAKPGRPGNIAIAGHRTGWGSPFLNLDDLQPGDRIKLTDRKGVRHTYVVDSSTLVDPSAGWVLGDDPLGTGEPTLTLTTCDPPSVNTERLIVFATLKKSVKLDGRQA